MSDLADCGGCGVLTDATEPYCDRCGFPEGSVMIERGWVAPATCAWFARCGRIAVTTRPHPIIGAVPVCARCAAFVDGEQR